MINTTENANFIWSIADLLRGDYEYQPLRSLSQIRADIMALEEELEDSLREILG
ncbi:MAG: hypothetical protein KAJ39_09065 [Gammaproteobacteria bacterium]|nr:hypothetical protein [Gammaproteobacteria bacterium]